MLKIIIIASILFLGSGVFASKTNFLKKSSKDSKDSKAISCVFRRIRDCYDTIGNLGANLTVEFPRSDRELNDTCTRKPAVFKDCTSLIEQTCDINLGSSISNVQDTVNDICKNGSSSQKTFLNGTTCYNSNVPETRRYYIKYATNKTDDAKALCCSVYKTKKCMNFLSNQCSKNATKLREKLAQTYFGPADAVCTKIYKQCSSAFTILPSNMWMSAAVVFLLSAIKLNDYKL